MLGELFSHDVEGLFGEMHVHAHAAGDAGCCGEDHSHTVAPISVEGRGVQPDRRVVETRAGLRSGRDPVLDAALVAVRASRRP